MTTAGARRTSVVIPCRDAAGTIERTLRSVSEQRTFVTEVIVVDDGSTDTSAAVVDSWAGEGAPVRLIRAAPRGGGRGVARARNIGIEAAQGDVIAFLDADDRWLPGTAERHYAGLAAAPAVFGDTFFESGGVVDPAPLSAHVRQPPSPTVLDLVTTRPVPLSTVAVERAAVVALGGFDEDLESCEDYDLWYRFLVAGGSMRCIPVALAVIAIRPDGLSADLDRYRRSMARVLEKLLARPSLDDTTRRATALELKALRGATHPAHERRGRV